MTRRALLLLTGCAFAQSRIYVCPMDPEVRSTQPGKCPRCGMTLVAGAPEPVEYSLEFRATPRNIPADRPVRLEFRVIEPQSSHTVTKFETIHEKLFHLFIVSEDLSYFSHEHPVLMKNGWLQLDTQLPRPGTYRLLADFAPSGATSQLVAHTFSTAGYTAPLTPPHLTPDIAPKSGANLIASLRSDPAQPLAGKKTMLFVHVSPADGLEQYLGAWAHLLAASDDLIDTTHDHPFSASGGPDLQFNLFFPRAAMYRVWIQMQRRGVLNTVAFTLPVQKL